MTNNPSWLKYEPIRYRGFYVKYSPPTNSNESRVYIRDTWFKTYLFIPYGSSLPNSHDILEKARLFLNSIGIETVGMVGANGYDTLLSTNFTTPLKKPIAPKVRKCHSSN